MNVTKEQKDNLNATITVQIDAADYQPNVERVLADYKKRANIPGFRPGKVPTGLIKKQYGKAVLFEEVNKLLQSSVSEYITNEKLDILGNPLPIEQEDIDWDANDSFSFQFELGLAPQIEVKMPARKKFDMYTIKASDAVIDEQIDQMAKRYGKMTTPEKATEEDMFSGSFVEVDKEGNVVEGGISKEGAYLIGTAIETKTVRGKIVKGKIGDDFTIRLKNFKEGFDVANLLGTDSHTLNDHSTGLFRFTLTHISRMDPAELNQELFDKLFGEGEVKSEEEFRARVQADMEKMYLRDAEQHLMNQVSEYLMDTVEMDLPDTFLKKWMQNSGEKPATAEEVEEQYPNMSKGLKWQLIENKIFADNNLQGEYQELVDFAKDILRQQYAQYGMTPNEEEVQKGAENILQNQEQAQQINSQLVDAKLKTFFKENLKLKESEISYDDFVKLVSNK